MSVCFYFPFLIEGIWDMKRTLMIHAIFLVALTLFSILYSMLEKWLLLKLKMSSNSLLFQFFWIVYPLLLGFFSIHFLIRIVEPGIFDGKQVKKMFYLLTWVLFLFLIGFTYIKFSYTMWVLPFIAFIMVLVVEKYWSVKAVKSDIS